MPTKTERFIRNHEAIKSRAIYAIFKRHKALFVQYLEAADQKSSRIPVSVRWEKKITEEDIIDPFLDEIAPDVPEYLVNVLPTIMEEGAKGSIARYKDLLPAGYGLAFDIETEPAAKYLADLEDLMLSQRDGSILKTTRDRLRIILEELLGGRDGYLVGELVRCLVVSEVLSGLVVCPNSNGYVIACQFATFLEVVDVLVYYFEYHGFSEVLYEGCEDVRDTGFPWTDGVLDELLVLCLAVAAVCVFYVPEDGLGYSECRANLVSGGVSLLLESHILMLLLYWLNVHYGIAGHVFMLVVSAL